MITSRAIIDIRTSIRYIDDVKVFLHHVQPFPGTQVSTLRIAA